MPRGGCVLLADHLCRADKYLCHFTSASDTVCCSKSQVKQMKVGVSMKGMSFDAPRVCLMH